MLEEIKNGPIVIGVYVDKDFWDYASGIFKHKDCKEPNHAVLLVGIEYSSNPEKIIAKIKNSWGVKWGEKGYMRIDITNIDEGCGYYYA